MEASRAIEAGANPLVVQPVLHACRLTGAGSPLRVRERAWGSPSAAVVAV